MPTPIEYRIVIEYCTGAPPWVGSHVTEADPRAFRDLVREALEDGRALVLRCDRQETIVDLPEGVRVTVFTAAEFDQRQREMQDRQRQAQAAQNLIARPSLVPRG